MREPNNIVVNLPHSVCEVGRYFILFPFISELIALLLFSFETWRHDFCSSRSKQTIFDAFTEGADGELFSFKHVIVLQELAFYPLALLYV